MGAFVSNAETAAYLGLDITVTSVNTDVTTFISIAESLISNYLETEITSSGADDVTKYFNGNNKTYIPVNPLIRTITSIDFLSYDGTVVYSGDMSYFGLGPTNAKNGLYRFIESKVGIVFPEGMDNIKVIGKFGMATIPDALKLAVYLTVKYLFDIRDIDQTIIEDNALGKGGIRRVDLASLSFLPRMVMKVLDGYKTTDHLIDVK